MHSRQVIRLRFGQRLVARKRMAREAIRQFDLMKISGIDSESVERIFEAREHEDT